MRVTQAVRQSVHGLVAIILLLTLTACFGGGGGGGDGGGSSGTDGETIISLPSGGQVVIPKEWRRRQRRVRTLTGAAR
jgi:hypothetical protein